MAGKRFVTAVVVLMAAQGALLFAGGQQSSAKTGGASSSPVNLGGVQIAIGRDSPERAFNVNTYVPTSMYGEQTLAWRKKIQQD